MAIIISFCVIAIGRKRYNQCFDDFKENADATKRKCFSSEKRISDKSSL